jgi:hypothetical protein
VAKDTDGDTKKVEHLDRVIDSWIGRLEESAAAIREMRPGADPRITQNQFQSSFSALSSLIAEGGSLIERAQGRGDAEACRRILAAEFRVIS